MTFPPTAPTMLTQILKAYVYKQYSDDDNIQAFNISFNGLAQQYLTYLINLNLPVYTALSGSLLDWVAEGLYGISRPSLQSGSLAGLGLYNTFQFNALMFNNFVTTGSILVFEVNDDIFKRIITWDFFKGDGFYFTAEWLKRRVMRFLIGTNGASPNIDYTYPVSVVFNDPNVVITITLSSTYSSVTLENAVIFQAAVATQAIQLPFQYNFSVVVVNNLNNTGLTNVGGVLHVTNTTGWRTSPGIVPGTVYNASGAVMVTPTTTPNPNAPIYLFGVITSVQLLNLGAENLPKTDPHNVFQLWNSANTVRVSAG